MIPTPYLFFLIGYLTVNTNLTFPAHSTTGCANITIIDNDLAEYDRLFYLQLSTLDSNLIVTNFFNVLIYNDDSES